MKNGDDFSMTASNRIVLSSDHAAIQLRQAIAVHIAAHGWVVVDIGPTTPESTHYPKHGEAAARLVASGDCRLGIILCGPGPGLMMAANKVKGHPLRRLRRHILSPHDPPAQRCQHAFDWGARGGRRAGARYRR